MNVDQNQPTTYAEDSAGWRTWAPFSTGPLRKVVFMLCPRRDSERRRMSWFGVGPARIDNHKGAGSISGVGVHAGPYVVVVLWR